jgi:hypothetical protein
MRRWIALGACALVAAACSDNGSSDSDSSSGGSQNMLPTGIVIPVNMAGGAGTAAGMAGAGSGDMAAGSAGASAGAAGAAAGAAGAAEGAAGAAGANAGTAGTAGSGTAGAAGTAGAGTAGSAGAGTAGTAGAGTAGTAGSAGGEAPSQACLDGFSREITACEMCLCQPSKCEAETVALQGDAPATAIVDCGTANGCTGECCVCGDVCEFANYGPGPCSDEVEMSLGLTPGAGAIANGTTVSVECDPTMATMADNSCIISGAFSECAAANCATECMTTTCP